MGKASPLRGLSSSAFTRAYDICTTVWIFQHYVPSSVLEACSPESHALGIFRWIFTVIPPTFNSECMSHVARIANRVHWITNRYGHSLSLQTSEWSGVTPKSSSVEPYDHPIIIKLFVNGETQVKRRRALDSQCWNRVSNKFTFYQLSKSNTCLCLKYAHWYFTKTCNR